MQPKVKRIYLPRAKLILSLLAGAFFVILITRLVIFTGQFQKESGVTPGVIFHLIFNGGSGLQNTDGRTNILLLGIGGGTHEGADLTDTMIVLSLTTINHKVALISVPRDIWSDNLKAKINSAYHYGEEKKPGGGMILTKAEVEDIVGLPIHYALLIDFSGFKELIDLVGGININVTKPFVDTQYPIEGKENDLCGGDPTYACRYEIVQFARGWQHMDGSRTLVYVRSRHAEGDEGSDFARNRRQQEVLVVLKQQIMSPWKWLTLAKLQQLPAVWDKMIDTDMSVGELLTVGKYLSRVNSDKITKIALDQLLYTPLESQYNNLFVLMPQDSFSAIHDYIKKQLP